MNEALEGLYKPILIVKKNVQELMKNKVMVQKIKKMSHIKDLECGKSN